MEYEGDQTNWKLHSPCNIIYIQNSGCVVVSVPDSQPKGGGAVQYSCIQSKNSQSPLQNNFGDMVECCVIELGHFTCGYVWRGGVIVAQLSLRASTSHSIGIPMQGETRMAMGNKR